MIYSKVIPPKFCKSLFAVLLLIGFTVNSVWAWGTKYAGEFLKQGSGVRALSLGGAVVAAPSEETAYFWNPAALVSVNSLSGQFMHAEEFDGLVNRDQLSLVFPKKQAFCYGLGLIRSGVDNIPYTRQALIDVGSDGLASNDPDYRTPDADGSENNGQLDPGERLNYNAFNTFGSSETAFYFAAAKKLSPQLQVGGSLKGIFKNLYQTKAWGIGLDLGAIYQYSSQGNIGLLISDLTTTWLFWTDGTKEMMPPLIRLGTDYLIQWQSLQLNLHPFLALDIALDDAQYQTLVDNDQLNLRYRAGLEILLKDRIALRIGRDDLNGAHIGLGLQSLIGDINYGFSMGSAYAQLGNSHRLALIIHFAKVQRWIGQWLE